MVFVPTLVIATEYNDANMVSAIGPASALRACRLLSGWH